MFSVGRFIGFLWGLEVYISCEMLKEMKMSGSKRHSASVRDDNPSFLLPPALPRLNTLCSVLGE